MQKNDLNGGERFENDVSAEMPAESKGSWLSEKNEYQRWKKSPGRQETEGQNETVCLMLFIVRMFYETHGFFVE